MALLSITVQDSTVGIMYITFFICFHLFLHCGFPFLGVMGEYEPKIEVQFPEVVHVAKGSTVKLECFALGK